MVQHRLLIRYDMMTELAGVNTQQMSLGTESVRGRCEVDDIQPRQTHRQTIQHDPLPTH